MCSWSPRDQYILDKYLDQFESAVWTWQNCPAKLRKYIKELNVGSQTENIGLVQIQRLAAGKKLGVFDTHELCLEFGFAACENSLILTKTHEIVLTHPPLMCAGELLSEFNKRIQERMKLVN